MPTVGAEGRYRLLRCLGRGGMGEVHLAVVRGAAGFEKLVAIKFLDDRSARDPNLARGLVREAFLGVQLDHEGIVSVLDFGEEEGRHFVVMEYVRGFTLAHVLSYLESIGQSMPVHSALHVARSALDALGYLHQLTGADGKPLGLVHGDVSPSNLLLAGDGRIKLADFGVAGLVGDVAERGRIAGKLPYLPPEAFAGAPRTQSWDVYAAAALLYEAIAGVPAFPATSVDAVRQALRRGPPSLSAHRPEVPAALAAVIEGALAFHAGRRPTTVADLRAALDRAAPRRVDDVDAHRALIASVYADPRFVQQHGQLPTTDGYSQTKEQEAAVGSTDLAVPTVGRVRTRALRFGVSPALGAAKAREVGERFTGFLGKALGREVRPVVLADYAMLVACLVDGEIDLAWMPPTSFISAAEHGAGILARIQRAGQTTYQSALFCRRDAGIAATADLRGKPVAWVDFDSASGYLFALAELRRQLGNPERTLGEQHFVGSHHAVCEAVAKGWAAAGATYVSRSADGEVVSSGWRDNLGERAEQIMPLWFSAPIPGDSIAHRPFLPDALGGALTEALLGLSGTADGRAMLADIFNAEALVRADIRDFDGVRAALDLPQRP